VNESVLIPRPETETLVEIVIEHLKDSPQSKIIDLGTGSGAIAISLAKNLRSLFVFATDISPDALRVAKENAKTLGVDERIEFLCGDLFEPLNNKNLKGTIDCVVSNPPYVSKSEFDLLPKEVKDHEPIIALKTDKEGISFHRRIIEGSLYLLKKGGILALEVGLGQANKVADLTQNHTDFQSTEIKKDLGGVDRIVVSHKI